MSSLPHNPGFENIQDTVPDIDQKSKQELALYGERKRKERFKNVMNWVFITFVIVMSLVATATISVRIIHLVLPSKYQWMSADQVQGIDKLFFSGAIGGILASYFKNNSENK